MASATESYGKRIERLRADLVSQGRRVQALVEAAFAALIGGDERAAASTVELDDQIDRVDVEIERACVKLLAEASGAGVGLTEEQFRSVLTVVKVNNELERTADRGVDIAERVGAIRQSCGELPRVFEVMTNSVVGIIRDTCEAFEKTDAHLARVVLRSEDTVEEFERQVLIGLEEQLATGSVKVETAFGLHEVSAACSRMADYCTNIAEQVLYVATGAIVRHTDQGWVDVGEG